MSSSVQEVLPVAGFLLSATVLADLVELTGLFDVLARVAVRRGGGSVLRLYLLVALVASLTTAVLSLDTTAVLLTPVVIAMARRAGVEITPFAICTALLANTASLLLPVSNLTNLLAVEHGLPGGQRFVGRMALPWFTAIAVTVLVVAIAHRRSLAGTFSETSDRPRTDALELWTASWSCLLLAGLVIGGVPAWIAALSAATMLAGVLMARRRTVHLLQKVPWVMTLAVLVVLVVAALITDHWYVHLPASSSFGGVLGAAGWGAVGANVVDNLPAYLALRPGAHGATQSMALLVGVNVGPLVTPWASVATMLWRQRCVRADVTIRIRDLAALGAVVAAISVPLCTYVLWLTR